jgi:hypothetical protein
VLRKFVIAILLVCSLFVPINVLNVAPKDYTGAGTATGLNTAALNKTAPATECSVDPKFNIIIGENKSDSNFHVGIIPQGVDAGFSTPICKGVSGKVPATPGGK